MSTKKKNIKNIVKSSDITESMISDNEADWISVEKIGNLRLDQLITVTEQLNVKGQVSKILELYEAWINQANSPVKFVAYFNYGVQLGGVQENEKAEEAYRQAIALKKDFIQPRINLGMILEKTGRQVAAIEEWQKIIDDPILARSANDELRTATLNQIGRVQENLREYALAEAALEQSLAVNPGQSDVIHHWIHLRQKQCKWPVLQELPGVSINRMIRAMSPLAMLAYADDPALQMLAADNAVKAKFNYSEVSLCKGRKYEHERIRIGYLSGDFCTHAVGLLLPEVFESHSKSKFEIYAYDYSREDGTIVRARIKSAIEHFVPVGHLSDSQVAECILKNEIDILVDMHGLSQGTRPGVLALRPAPIQATFLGYIGTTGMPWIDYVIADKYSLPENLTPYYSERPIYLECSCLPGDSKREVGKTPTRAEVGLPETGFVFASFNNAYKLNEKMFESWMEIVKKVRGSVLWLVDDNQWATANLKKRAVECGVEEQRLVFSARVQPADYRARMQLADLFLDNIPYNAGSTASDAVWMGLPVLTLSGKTFVARMAGGLLNHIGASELIANTEREYIDKAVELAEKPGLMQQVREKMNKFRTNEGAEFGANFARSLEKVYLEMIENLRI